LQGQSGLSGAGGSDKGLVDVHFCCLFAVSQGVWMTRRINELENLDYSQGG
jgi:hypothetical protein